ncbi:MAG: hypothetical protein WKF84_02330 [Pyrinomonadaceae bacterium]
MLIRTVTVMLGLALLFNVSGGAVVARQQKADAAFRAHAFLPRVQKVLTDNIAAFWFEKAVDRKYGGYIVSYGPRGELRENGTKMIVTQARTLWLFARLARAGHRRQEALLPLIMAIVFCANVMWMREAAVSFGR